MEESRHDKKEIRGSVCSCVHCLCASVGLNEHHGTGCIVQRNNGDTQTAQLCESR